MAGPLGHPRVGIDGGQLCVEPSRFDRDLVGSGMSRAAECLDQSVPCDEQTGARIGEVEGHFPLLEQNVHWDHHRPGPQDAVIGDGELRHVGHHQPHPVARRDPQRTQQGRHPSRAVIELAVGDDLIVEAQRRAITAP